MDARKRWGRCELLSTPTPLLFSFFPLATRLQIKRTGDLTRATPRGNEPSWHTPPPSLSSQPQAPRPLGQEQKRKIELFWFPPPPPRPLSFQELASPLEILVGTGTLKLWEQAGLWRCPSTEGALLGFEPRTPTWLTDHPLSAHRAWGLFLAPEVS